MGKVTENTLLLLQGEGTVQWQHLPGGWIMYGLGAFGLLKVLVLLGLYLWTLGVLSI